MITQASPSLPAPQVDSFSARQVNLLLRTVRAHQSHLDGAHHDARHLWQDHLHPAYVLDFDLLYHYMFQTSPDWTQALEYLFFGRSCTCLVGPGTRIEIDRFIRTAATGDESVRAHNAQALERLEALLSRPNVLTGDAVPVGVDDAAYRLVKESLDLSRRRSTEVPNQADALNWAYVVHLRRNVRNYSLDFFPYLLTGTSLLLDEQALDPNHTVPISRDAQTAIYAEVLLRLCPDARQALRHTVEVSFQCARIEYELRLSAAYADPAQFPDERDWEAVVSEGRVGPRLRDQLQDLAGYVHDPVLNEAQRLYDNAYFTATNQAQLDGTYMYVGETPRRLFDLITAINASLSIDSTDGGGLAQLWDTVMTLVFTRAPECTTVELVDRTGRIRQPYLAVEVHPPAPSRDRPLFILRWPSSRDAAGLVSAFTSIFAFNGVSDVALTLGTQADVYEFDADLPVTLEEMRDALAANTGAREDARGDKHELMWLRADSPEFDLYADLQAPVPQDALVGVFGEALINLPIGQLYQDTSARYLFVAWLRAALADIGAKIREEPTIGGWVPPTNSGWSWASRGR